MTCFLYRHFNEAGELLYVGISLCAIARLEQHKRSSWFSEIRRIEIEHYSTREDAQLQEAMAIRLEKPKYNKITPDLCSDIAVIGPSGTKRRALTRAQIQKNYRARVRARQAEQRAKQ